MTEDNKSTTEQPKFSQAEIDKFVTAGKRLTNRPLLTLLKSTLEAGPTNKRKKINQIINQIEKLKEDHHGFTSVSFHEMPHQLNIQLTMVNKGYKTSIDIPDVKYAKELFDQYNLLKQFAVAYWRQFCEENKDLFAEICDCRDDVDFTNLVIDADNPTVMYFDPKHDKQIGIFCYYSDGKQALYKKQH